MSTKTIISNITIIGAGVVGCAIARHLSLKNPYKKIVVFDKLPEGEMETSGKNSGVLHSGLHQDPAFLKSKLARIGNKLAVDYCNQKNIPILHTGMIIAVSKKAFQEGIHREIGSFIRLLKKGKAQGVKFKFLLGKNLKKLEPNIEALGGIFIPNVWVIDFVRFTENLKKDAEKNGVEFIYKAEVANIIMEDKKYFIKTSNHDISTDIIINSAGLYADNIANMAGFNEYKIYPWRGEYYEIIGERKNLVKRLIYPVVSKNSPGKGIHFSPRVDGRLYLGPNARPVPRKDYYEEDKTPVENFLHAAQRFFPQIKKEDLQWAYSGIRAKGYRRSEAPASLDLMPARGTPWGETPHRGPSTSGLDVWPSGAGETDFIISLDRQNPPFINLIGIESPGLTAAMAIAEYVNNLI